MNFSTSVIETQARRASSVSFYLIIGIAVLLVSFGTIMVFSASSILNLENNVSPLADFAKQCTFGAIGLAAMFICSIIPHKVYDKLIVGALIVIIILLIAVCLFGKSVGGNKNWLPIFGTQFQPSEFAKTIMIYYFGIHFAKLSSSGEIRDFKKVFFNIRFYGPTIIIIFAVMYGEDLGTAIVLGVIILAALYFAGAPIIWIIGFSTIGLAGAAVLSRLSSSRWQRILATYQSSYCAENLSLHRDICQQPLHGKWALASGGLFGAGAGGSREKWGYIPAATNDFIFTIVGEEMGLLGTSVIIICFIILAIAMLRIVRYHRDVRAQIVVGAIMSWIVFQAVINIGAAVGSLPVIGVTLPFISSGGTSMLSTLIGVGVVLSFARTEAGSEMKVLTQPIKHASKDTITFATNSPLKRR
jgi:cell division protein FtsW